MNTKFNFKLKPAALVIGISLSISSIMLGSTAHAARGTIYNETLGNDITVEASASAYPTFVGHAFGVYIQQDQHTVVGDRLTITVSGEGADGLRSNPSGMTNWQQAKGSITVGDDLKITMKGVSGDGINANGSTKIIVGDNAIISTEYAGELKYSNGSIADGSHGVRANFHSEINIGNGLTSTTKGQESYAIYSAQGLGFPGATEGAKVTIGTDGTGITDGNKSHAAYVASSKGFIKMGDRATLITKGTNAHTAYISSSNGQINLGSSAILKTEGEKSYTLYTTGAGSSTVIGNEAQLSTEGLDSHLIYSTAKNGTIELGNNSKLTSSGDNSYGILLSGYRNASGSSTYGNTTITLGNNTQIITKGDTSYGVYMYGHDGKVTLGENTQVSTTGATSHALYGHGSQATPTSPVYGDNGQIILKDNISLSTTGAGAHGAYVDWATSSIDFQGATTISATGVNSYALYANAGTISSSSAAKYNVTGDMKVDDAGTIDLHMTNGSYFKGNTFVTGASGTLNLNIAGASSVWQMTEDSQLTNLDLSSDAQVRVGNQATAITAANQVTLTTENLSGNGQFYLRTSIIDSDDIGPGINISDKIKVTGTSSGNHKILVKDNNTGGAVGTEIVRVAEIADGVAQFTLSNVNGYVDMGAYRYSLNEVDPVTRVGEKHWYLIAGTKTGGGNEKTATADHSANILNINYLLNYVETQTLLQRMGELRKSEGSDGDVWVRAYTGKLDSFSDGILEGFDMDYSGIQIGADKHFAQDSGDFYLGGMLGTAEAKANYKVGDGKATSYHAGVYATYKHTNGFYVDGIAKFVRMENTLNTETGGGYAVKGDGNTSGYSIGVEAGKRFYFKEANAGWYAEPQAQITFAHQDGATIQANNGLRTDLDSFDSTLGRISAIIGYSIVDGTNPVDVYFKTGYVKEFDGDTGYTYNNAIHESYKLNGNWWDNGIGINAQINKQHNLYLDATYSSGSKFDQMQINAGYRYAF